MTHSFSLGCQLQTVPLWRTHFCQSQEVSLTHTHIIVLPLFCVLSKGFLSLCCTTGSQTRPLCQRFRQILHTHHHPNPSLTNKLQSPLLHNCTEQPMSRPLSCWSQPRPPPRQETSLCQHRSCNVGLGRWVSVELIWSLGVSCVRETGVNRLQEQLRG